MGARKYSEINLYFGQKSLKTSFKSIKKNYTNIKHKKSSKKAYPTIRYTIHSPEMCPLHVFLYKIQLFAKLFLAFKPLTLLWPYSHKISWVNILCTKNNLEKCCKLTPILVKIPPKIISFYIFTNERLKSILILFEFKNKSKGSSLVKKLITY